MYIQVKFAEISIEESETADKTASEKVKSYLLWELARDFVKSDCSFTGVD